MATDEREWTLEHRLGWEHWTVCGPSTHAEIVKVVPKARAEAAEQRVREMERRTGVNVPARTNVVACPSCDGSHKAPSGYMCMQCGGLPPRDMATADSWARQRHKKDMEAKLATAVEALEFYANGKNWLGGSWPAVAHVDRGKRAQRALAEIEGEGDA